MSDTPAPAAPDEKPRPKDPALYAPLARFVGARPPAPAWFDRALARAPQETRIRAAGAEIETLTWGDVGKPGLLFMHGNGAHAGWWRFIAPFFADRYRIAAFSWSGMGASDWRPHYTLEVYVEEILAVAEAAGLFAGVDKPLAVAHSFGSFPMAEMVTREGARFKAAIVIDSPFLTPQRREERRKERGVKPRRPRELTPHNIYPSLNAALARFRLAPLQACDNLYIADLIAREGLKQVENPQGGEGWSWRFDPFLWRDFHLPDLTDRLGRALCPMALIRGARSQLINDWDAFYSHALMRPGSPLVTIPDSDHHIMVDQPLALVAALETLFAAWPANV